MSHDNLLMYGDNLPMLREHVASESVDLVYLDPPFNSSRKYNLLFKESSGDVAQAHIKAFEDTWHWGDEAERTYRELATGGAGETIISLVSGFVKMLGRNDVTAYIVMMTPRLIELRRVLKATGSIYLHSDPTMSAYLKLLLDAIFGPDNFRNEIVWKRTTAHSDSQRFSHVTDTIFYYTKSSEYTWNPQHQPHDISYLQEKYGNIDADGRRYYLGDMNSPNPRPNMMYEWKGYKSPPLGWRFERKTMERLDAEGRIYYPKDKKKRPRVKRYLDENPGELLDNLWTDIPPINSQAKERLGYPTQKPLKLLERIILASSNEGDVVLDPFCGCGTTIDAAQGLDRKWVGIDITHLAIALIRWRLETRFVGRAKFTVIGEPVDVSGAQALADQDRYQFQYWAISLVEAFPIDEKMKKGADGGVDGYIRFIEDNQNVEKIVVQVKSGHVGVKDIKELRTTILNSGSVMGVFVTLEEPTRPMKIDALTAGTYHSEMWQADFPVVQIITVAELLSGKRPKHPPSSIMYKGSEAHKKAVVAPTLFGHAVEMADDSE